MVLQKGEERLALHDNRNDKHHLSGGFVGIKLILFNSKDLTILGSVHIQNNEALCHKL